MPPHLQQNHLELPSKVSLQNPVSPALVIALRLIQEAGCAGVEGSTGVLRDPWSRQSRHWCDKGLVLVGRAGDADVDAGDVLGRADDAGGAGDRPGSAAGGHGLLGAIAGVVQGVRER